MVRITLLAFLGVAVGSLVVPASARGAAWVVPDWAGKEPTFPPGSLYWQTGKYRTCPVLFRTVIEVADKPVAFAGFQAKVSGFAYAFVNGKQIATVEPKDTEGVQPFEVELTGLLRRGPNILIFSTRAEGFSLDGGVAYQGGQVQRFGSGKGGWKVQKLAPLSMSEYQPCMQAGVDDSGWFAVKEGPGEATELADADLRALCGRLAEQRLKRLDEDGRWRLTMLAEKGIAVVDWEAHGWAGAERLPAWLRKLAVAESGETPAAPGAVHARAEALCQYVVLSEEALNLANQAVGLSALGASAADVTACKQAAEALRTALTPMEEALKTEKFDEALTRTPKAREISQAVRKRRLINDLNRCLDNKFGWFDSPAVLDSDPAGWGLTLGPSAQIFTNPLSPAALVTARGGQLVIRGWDQVKPLRVYNRQRAAVGPVCMWAMLGGKLTNLKPDTQGVVYDAQAQGKLSENWVLLVNDFTRGGDLPIQLVFLQAPSRIALKTGETGTTEVAVSFEKPEVQLFILRPLMEWRGLLEMAQVMTAQPLRQQRIQVYLDQCRLWSRAVLDYPVTFSEAFVREAEDGGALRVADVYNYRTFQDEWGTKPLRLAALPPLATYGLLTKYPGLKVLSDTQLLGSRGIWGDHLAVRDQDYVAYRVPLDPIQRYAGFTGYCFGPTDIGEPGGLKEIETIQRTGSNSWRPQHNNNSQRARDTVEWCRAQGIQQVFNCDEKWVADVVEHFRSLAKQYKDYPPGAVAYDPLNEPETRDPRAYGALLKKVTNAIREHDTTHLIYFEAMPPWGPGAAPFPRGTFETLVPTGDELTVYSFHDYQYRLEPRWPNGQHDIRLLLTKWIPVFRFSIEQRRPIHLGEFGGFEQTKQSVFNNPCALTMMMDYINVFDQFGWHWHYYSNRGVVRVRRDGSLGESYIQEACRRYFTRGTFNANYSALREK
jgi:hypothetical protein